MLKAAPVNIGMRITLAPAPGLSGNSKAVKGPDSLAGAIELAAAKEILGPGVKPTRLFFSDGGEIDADAWELVGENEADKLVYVSAGQPFSRDAVPASTAKDEAAPAATISSTAVAVAKAAPPKEVAVAQGTVPVTAMTAGAAADATNIGGVSLAQARTRAGKLGYTSMIMHAVAFCSTLLTTEPVLSLSACAFSAPCLSHSHGLWFALM